jgi:putative ABC transport system permease protein
MPRIAFRFRREGALALAVCLTIAVGVAGLTATAGYVNAALFRQPPFEQADRLDLLFLERHPRGEAPGRDRWSFGRLELLRASQHSFEAIASFSPAAVTLSTPADPESIQAERVSASYFDVLRARPILGRVFAAEDDVPGQPTPVIVIGESLWQRRWARDGSVVGRTVRINGVPMTVIGVMPGAFGGLSGRSELWIPRTMSPRVTYPEYLTTNQNFISAIGRLRSDVDITSARKELALLGARINRALPSDPDFPEEQVTASAVPLNEARVDRTLRRSLLILLAGVGLLHLLACANVINLLLGRAAMKRREFAIRIALGSSGQRLFWHIFRDGFLITALGGAFGVVIAWASARVLAPPSNAWGARGFYGSVAPFDAPHFGVVELVSGLALTLVTASLVAAMPALSGSRSNVLGGIRAGSRGLSQSGMSLRRPGERGFIVALESALAMMLVVVSALLVDSYRRMQQARIGVEPSNVLTFWVLPSDARIPPASAPLFVRRLLDALSRVPGVESASVDGGAPLAGSASTSLFIIGRPTPPQGQEPIVLRHYVGPDHFRTLGIPLLRGRALAASDVVGAPMVTVISEGAARRFWPNEDPIGQRVWFGSGTGFSSPDSSAEIVGVVGDVAYLPLDQPQNPASFYTSYEQFTYASRMVFVRARGDPMALVPGLRKAVAMVDPELGLRDIQTLRNLVDGSWARHRFDAILFGGFAIVALLLAASGIFAVLAHAVGNRTREFGIRIALGAHPTDVIRQVLREGLAFPIVGLIAGVLGALALSRMLQSSIYDASPFDPAVLSGTVGLLLVVAIVACLVPAMRATRADPVTALRGE